jgi:polygalacturonase
MATKLVSRNLALLLALAMGMSTNVARATTLNIHDSGAIGDGVTLDTDALQKAIDTCSAQGGGTLVFPKGRYLTGTIEIKDNVTLHLDAQAVLLGSTNAADYRNLDPFMAGDGVELGYALIVAMRAKHVGIEGPGAIDGQGKALAAAEGHGHYTVRPFLLRWIHCTDVMLKDINLRNPGSWTNHFFQCQNVSASSVTIRSRGSGLVNNDGIDIDSCQTVRVSNCDIESGDDAICLKATSALPCRDIAITGCELSTWCNAIKLGTESLGDFENIQVSQCEIRNTGMAGIALYSVDGAQMQNVTFSDITMDDVQAPISVRLGARLKTFREGDQSKPPGSISNITIKNVRATNARRMGILVNGIPNHPVENLSLESIQIELAGGGKADEATVKLPEKESAYPEVSMFGHAMPAYGLYLRHVHGLTLMNIGVSFEKTDLRPAMACSDVDGLQIDNFNAELADGVTPALFDDVTHMTVTNSPVLQKVLK